MAKMAESGSGKSGKARRARRSFSDELKAGAVALVLKESGTITHDAEDLDLTDSALRGWVERA